MIFCSGLILFYWKGNFSMTQSVGCLVGLSVCHSFLKGGKFHLHSLSIICLFIEADCREEGKGKWEGELRGEEEKVELEFLNTLSYRASIGT